MDPRRVPRGAMGVRLRSRRRCWRCDPSPSAGWRARSGQFGRLGESPLGHVVRGFWRTAVPPLPYTFGRCDGRDYPLLCRLRIFWREQFFNLRQTLCDVMRITASVDECGADGDQEPLGHHEAIVQGLELLMKPIDHCPQRLECSPHPPENPDDERRGQQQRPNREHLFHGFLRIPDGMSNRVPPVPSESDHPVIH